MSSRCYSVGFESITGLYPSNPQWINQDNYGVFVSCHVLTRKIEFTSAQVPFGADEELSFYAVFDGHGTYGGTASAFAREKIVEYLEKTYERFREDPKAVLREALVSHFVHVLLCVILHSTFYLSYANNSIQILGDK